MRIDSQWPVLRSATSPAVGERDVHSLGETSFEQMLLRSLDAANAMQQHADAAVTQSLIGGDMTQIEVLAAVKQADLSLRLMLQIRNKILEAYQEIQQMRM